MAIRLQAYTAEGLLTGAVAAEGRLVELLASTSPVIVENAVITPFEGPPQVATGWSSVEVDDLMVVVATPETVAPVHAAWHILLLDVGPYRVRGELPALPGFDPARALARPTGPFVLLARLTVKLRAGGPAGVSDQHALAFVNRYAVDAVESDIHLGFFFPAARDRQPSPANA